MVQPTLTLQIVDVTQAYSAYDTPCPESFICFYDFLLFSTVGGTLRL